MRKKNNALVAVTNPGDRHLLEKALEESGYSIVAAENPDELISLARQLLPPVIMLSADFGGGEGGLTLGRHLKADPIARFCALIMVCGRDHRLPDCGREEQPDEILVLPIHPPEVRVRLRSVKRLQRFASEAVEGSKLDSLTGTFNNAYMLDRLHHEVLRASREGPPGYDGIAELWWKSREAMQEALSTAEGLEAGRILLEDERRFIDLARSPLWLAEEHEIIPSAGE